MLGPTYEVLELSMSNKSHFEVTYTSVGPPVSPEPCKNQISTFICKIGSEVDLHVFITDVVDNLLHVIDQSKQKRIHLYVPDTLGSSVHRLTAYIHFPDIITDEYEQMIDENTRPALEGLLSETYPCPEGKLEGKLEVNGEISP